VRPAALALSEIPLEKTIAGVRVGMIDGNYVINPTFEERKQSMLDLVVAGSKDGIVMVEAGAKEVTEAQAVGALEAAHAAIKQIVASIDELKGTAGKKKLTVDARPIDHAFYREVEEKAYLPLAEAMRIRDKLENYTSVDAVFDELIATIPEEETERRSTAKSIFHELKEKVLRDEVLQRSVRLDGRKFDEIRPIWSEAGVLPRPTARSSSRAAKRRRSSPARSAPRTTSRRSSTWAASSTSASCSTTTSRPFSVGEVQFLRGPGRREVGPWRARGTCARVGRTGRGQVRLHGSSRVRHPRVERLIVDGVGLRWLDGDDGCRRSHQGAGRGHRDGAHHGREERQVGRPLGHRRR
jgi:polyribonucleotide nucleotidyltransferase